MADGAHGVDAGEAAAPRVVSEAATSVVAAREGHAVGLLPKELREGRAAPVLVAAMITWTITVAPVGFARGAPLAAGFAAVLALAAGLGGALLLAKRPP